MAQGYSYNCETTVGRDFHMCYFWVGVPKAPVLKYHYEYDCMWRVFEGGAYFTEHCFKGWHLFQGVV